MAKEHKTNVMRILEKEKISYQFYYYSHEDGQIDGISVAHKLNQPVEQVFKTLVTRGASKNFYVFVIPVEEELDLKAAAQSVSEKSVEMVHVSEINQITGYIRGGCSPVGMKKQFQTVIDESCLQLPTIIVSGGKIGTQVELAPADLITLIAASTAPLCK
ncbi:Cys-tRNA(Pro) deacylase [Faecalispora anaeroviscerum]|uniref:Cys-tRNA(Pro) deacylase n=1 Tax=Faecalispora anaeroviscerum TaxID=2991836 RepID=UPI0024BAA039|nr:Cys-tRNA(Pro) deacylase [Faecalispora anaeroviscerum]